MYIAEVKGRRFGTSKSGLNHPQSLLLTVQRQYFRCVFIHLMFGVVQFLDDLIQHFSVSNLFNSVKATELPPLGKSC